MWERLLADKSSLGQKTTLVYRADRPIQFLCHQPYKLFFNESKLVKMEKIFNQNQGTKH